MPLTDASIQQFLEIMLRDDGNKRLVLNVRTGEMKWVRPGRQKDRS